MFFLKLLASRGERISTVKLDCLGEDISEAGNEIFSRTFLAIDARNLFDQPIHQSPSCFGTAVYCALISEV